MSLLSRMRHVVRRLCGDRTCLPPADSGVVNEHLLGHLRSRFAGQPRRIPGRLSAGGWDLEYVDGPALINGLETLVLKRWNDFSGPHDHPYILDCGANIGLSVLRYKSLYPKARIVAFEPDPEIVPMLKRNLQRNAASDVEVVEAAVWWKEGTAEWFCEGADGSRIVGAAQEGQLIKKVATIDFGNYLGRPVDLLKMDIEGAEFEVIPKLGDRLSVVQQMIVECHVMCDQAEPLAKVIEALVKSGFKLTVNGLGERFDLIHKPARSAQAVGFDQYLLLAAWRE